jgi:hypothetical protein
VTRVARYDAQYHANGNIESEAILHFRLSLSDAR